MLIILRYPVARVMLITQCRRKVSMNSKIYRIVGIAALAGTMLGLQACWGGGHGYDPYGYGGQSYGYSGSSYGYSPNYYQPAPAPVVVYEQHPATRYYYRDDKNASRDRDKQVDEHRKAPEVRSDQHHDDTDAHTAQHRDRDDSAKTTNRDPN